MEPNTTTNLSANLIVREQLAIDRTVLANERTLLAYARTALALIAIGATAISFYENIWMIVMGSIGIGLGVIGGIIGGVRYRTMHKRLGLARAEPLGSSA